MSTGWIKVHRKVKEHWLYQDTPFDRYHAWEDLLLSVNHEQNTFLHGNKLLTIERGQVVTSLRKLGKRWGWNQEKVRKFLYLLQSDGMAEILCDTTMTLITVANWDVYQSPSENDRHGLDTALTQNVTNKNDKNDKNVKEQIYPVVVTRDCASAESASENQLARISAFYAETMGKLLSPEGAVMISGFLEHMEPAVIIDAISKAKDENVYKLSYVKGILSSRKATGIKTMTDVARDNAAHDASKSGAGRVSRRIREQSAEAYTPSQSPGEADIERMKKMLARIKGEA